MCFFLLALLASAACALPQDPAATPRLEDRETPCIALGDCGGEPAPPAASSSIPPPPPTLSASAPATPSPSVQSTGGDFGKFAVLGDSFASGVAWLVSKRYNYTDSDTCRRYFEAYGPQMEEDGRLGPNAELHFLACSGSRTDVVKNNQIPAIPQDSAFATVSVGGNDVGFFPVMDACVLRSSDSLTDQDCQNELAATANRITNDVPGYSGIYSSVFDIGLTDPNFKLYVLGYPHFFNVDTDQCDTATFAYYNDTDGGPFLTKDIRNSINSLIQQMNVAIGDAVASLNDNRVQFVDISPFFNGHRFCEEGIKEPYSGGIFTGIDDDAAWLYHFDWSPFHEMNDDPSQATDYPPATWSCDQDLLNDNDAGAVLQCGLAGSGVTSNEFGGTLIEKDGSNVSTDTLSGGNSGDPSQYGLFQRTFHPTHRGHTAIKDALFAAIGVA